MAKEKGAPGTDEQAVLRANDAFYQAFAKGDLAAMEALWARDAAVACIHPGWAALFGRDEVMASWHAILGGPSVPRIRCVEPRIFVFDDLAFVICYEAIERDVLVATNLFVREEGAWRLAHHQAGPANYRPEGEQSRTGGTLH